MDTTETMLVIAIMILITFLIMVWCNKLKDDEYQRRLLDPHDPLWDRGLEY